jgi:putative flippase GtrA
MGAQAMSLQFFWYCVCGGSGVLSDVLLFRLLVGIGLNYQLANACGYLAGTLLSFFLNRVITFGVLDKTGQRLLVFLLVALCGYLASSLLLWLLVDVAQQDPFWAKLATLPLVVALQFGLNRKITFHTRPNPAPDSGGK